MPLTPSQVRTLEALQVAPHSAQEIAKRWREFGYRTSTSGRAVLYALSSGGLISPAGGRYEITALGQQAIGVPCSTASQTVKRYMPDLMHCAGLSNWEAQQRRYVQLAMSIRR